MSSFALGAPPAPVPRTRSQHRYQEGEQLGPWTVGEETLTKHGARGRRCICSCGRRFVLAYARLSDIRMQLARGDEIIGCRRCAADAKKTERSSVVERQKKARAAAAARHVTLDTHVKGALTHLRELDERHSSKVVATRERLAQMEREERENGNTLGAAWIGALRRLDEYARRRS